MAGGESQGVETLMLFLVALGENEKEMKREREEKGKGKEDVFPLMCLDVERR